MQTDMWCANCKQMVRPKIGAHAPTYIIPIAIVSWTIYHYWMSPDYFMALIVGGGIAALVGGVEVAIWPERSCPICKTTKLEKQAPAE